MLTKDRDELLGRLDERTRNIYTLTEKQEKHLEKINGAITEQRVKIEKNTVRIGLMWKLGGGLFVIISGILIKVLTG